MMSHQCTDAPSMMALPRRTEAVLLTCAVLLAPPQLLGRQGGGPADEQNIGMNIIYWRINGTKKWDCKDCFLNEGGAILAINPY